MLGMHILLAVALAAFSNALSLMGIFVSFVLVYLVLKIGAQMMGVSQYVRRVELGTQFVFWFAGEVFKASIDVARVVFAIDRKPSPAIIKIALQRPDDRMATLVGCLLTLTPGTMALEYDRNDGVLYIHALDADSLDTIEQGIREIENRLLRWVDAGQRSGEDMEVER